MAKLDKAKPVTVLVRQGDAAPFVIVAAAVRPIVVSAC